MVSHPLTYDWNSDGLRARPAIVLLFDETLRDGLNSPSLRTPAIEQKIEILNQMNALGIDSIDIGLPGAGQRAAEEARQLVRAIVDARMTIRPACAARAAVADVTAIVELAQRTGVLVECCTFVGSGPIRRYAEGWTLDQLCTRTETAVELAVKEGLPVMFVAEDTTRTNPGDIRALVTAAIRAGASRLCITDTAGHATPDGARAIVTYIRSIVAELGASAAIDWYGRNDRGLGVACALAASEAGASRLHGAALGIGERAGNTPMDLLLVNLVLMGFLDRDLTGVCDYARAAAHACDVQIPTGYPVVGANAFRTSAGVHASAMLKARQQGDRVLSDAVFTGVPASLVHREPAIEIGPGSGRANVLLWLETHGLPASDHVIDHVLAAAKASNRLLSHEQIQQLVDDARKVGFKG